MSEYFYVTEGKDHGSVSAGISDIKIDFIDVREEKREVYVEASSGAEEKLSGIEAVAKIRDRERVSSRQIIRLPFTVEAFDEDAILAINMNFNQIEYHLSILQAYMNAKGFQSLSAPIEETENIVLFGLDSRKPQNIMGRSGRYFYWATDTEMLYALVPIRKPPSPRVSASISEVKTTFIEVFYVRVPLEAENISASLEVAISFTHI